MKILIDNGHGSNTLGKCSPDKRLLEYKYCREIAEEAEKALRARGYDAERIVRETTDIPITTRCTRVNNICAKVGAKNVLLVSIHNNASSVNPWGTARGFSVFVSKNASANSKRCAAIFTDYAIARKLMGNRSIPACKYWTWSWTTKDIGILKNSACPAILTENLFMNNREDVDFLLSAEGRKAIVDLHVEAIERYIKTASV